MGRWIAVCLALLATSSLLACGTVLKPDAPDRRLQFDMNGDVFAGSNGYTFAVLSEGAASVVRVQVRYRVGSRHDPVGKEGLAHLTEHLLTEVEIERDGRPTSIAAEHGRIAHATNAMTALDYTDYFAQGPREALGDLLRLEVERLTVGCAGISEALFAREKEIVLAELEERLGADGGDLLRKLYAAIYPPSHPYRRWDSLESVRGLTRDDVCAFLAGPYREGPVYVVVTGGVHPAEIRGVIAKHFSQATPRVPETTPPPQPVSPDPGRVRIAGDVEEPELLAVWPLPPWSSREYRLLALARSHIERRLGAFATIYGWGHSADVSVVGGKHAPQLAVSVTLRSASDMDDAVDAVERSLDHAFPSLHKSGEDQDSPHWQRTRWAAMHRLIGRWDSLAGRAAMFLEYLQFDREPLFLIGRLREFEDTTPEEVRRTAERHLVPSKARYLLIEPSGASGRGRRSSSYVAGTEGHHGVVVDPSEADRPLELPVATGLTLRTIRYTTDNGLDVVFWPHGTLPLVRGRLLIDSGRAHEPDGGEGIALLQGADWSHHDHLAFSAQRLSTHADELVRALALELRIPSYEFSDEERDFLKGRLRMQSRARRSSFELAFLQALYGEGHPYARPSMTEDSLDAIGTDRVKRWGRAHIVPSNATFLLAGSFDPDLMKQHIAYHTDHIDAGSDSPAPDARPVPGGSRAILGEDRADAPQVEIDVGFVGGRGVDAAYGARLVLEGILSSKLAELREQRALTYGFHASYSPRAAGGLWRLGGSAPAARAPEAARAVQRILAEMRADPRSYRAEFALARRKLVESLLASASDSSAITQRLTMLARFDLPDDYYDRLVAAIAAMRLEDVHALVVSELAPTAAVFGAFGPRPAAEATLAAAREPVELTPAPATTEPSDPGPAAAEQAEPLVDPFEP